MDLLELFPSRYKEEAFYRAIFSFDGRNLSDQLLQRGNLSPEFLGEVLIEATMDLVPNIVAKLLERKDIPLEALRKSLDIAIRNGYKGITEKLREALNDQ